MIKISDALRDIIQKNNFLEFGLSEDLLNLTATSTWIKPLIETRTKKEISTSAILMALTRYKKQKTKIKPILQNFKLLSINIKPGLTELTYPNTSQKRDKMLKLINKIQNETNHLSLNISVKEITTVFPSEFYEKFKNSIGDDGIFEKNNLAALCIDFLPQYVSEPYLLYYLIQQITLQNINIWEISSTYTEIIFYLEEKDVRLAFDTLYVKFMGK